MAGSYSSVKLKIVKMDNWLNFNKRPCWDSIHDPVLSEANPWTAGLCNTSPSTSDLYNQLHLSWCNISKFVPLVGAPLIGVMFAKNSQKKGSLNCDPFKNYPFIRKTLTLPYGETKPLWDAIIFRTKRLLSHVISDTPGLNGHNVCSLQSLRELSLKV